MYYILIDRCETTDTLEFETLQDTQKAYNEMCYYYGHDCVRAEDENGLALEF